MYRGGAGLCSAGPSLAKSPVASEFPQCCGAPWTASAALSRVALRCIPATRFSVFVLPNVITPGTSGRRGFERRPGSRRVVELRREMLDGVAIEEAITTRHQKSPVIGDGQIFVTPIKTIT